jgi:hypothetical protein
MSVLDIRNNPVRRAVRRWKRTVPLKPDACPDARVLTRYCEGLLSQGDKDLITKHLVKCEPCYFAVTESVRISQECAELGRTPRRWVAQLAGAAALFLTTAVLVSLTQRHGQSHPEEVFVPTGSTQLRIRTDVSGADLNKTPSDADDRRVSEDTASELAAALSRTVPETFHSRTVSAASSEPRNRRVVPGPIEGKPEPALDLGAVNHRVQNEIARFYLERWRETRDIQDAVAAFRAANRALTAGPELLDARFNVASALEAMATSLQDEARKALEQYLSADTTSSRALEIMRRLNTHPMPKDAWLVTGLQPRPSAEKSK